MCIATGNALVVLHTLLLSSKQIAISHYARILMILEMCVTIPIANTGIGSAQGLYAEASITVKEKEFLAS